MKCGYWARSDIPAPPNDTGEGAHYGIVTHAIAEHHSTGVELDLQALANEHELTPEKLEQAKVDGWALYTWHQEHIGGTKYHEQKVAYNVNTRTARVLTEPEPRDYTGCVDGEFPGTADLIAVKPGTVCVVDYKTGHTPWEIYKDQLNFLGLAAARIYDATRVVCIVLKVASGECYPHHWVLEKERIDEFEGRFITAFLHVPGSEPSPGPHCVNLYCPMASTCPATLSKLEQYTGADLLSNIDSSCDIKDDEQANKLYEIKALLTKTGDAVKKSLKLYVDQSGGFLLPNGKMYMKDKGSYKETRVRNERGNENG